jgi:hypothetical protein
MEKSGSHDVQSPYHNALAGASFRQATPRSAQSLLSSRAHDVECSEGHTSPRSSHFMDPAAILRALTEERAQHRAATATISVKLSTSIAAHEQCVRESGARITQLEEQQSRKMDTMRADHKRAITAVESRRFDEARTHEATMAALAAKHLAATDRMEQAHRIELQRQCETLKSEALAALTGLVEAAANTSISHKQHVDRLNEALRMQAGSLAQLHEKHTQHVEGLCAENDARSAAAEAREAETARQHEIAMGEVVSRFRDAAVCESAQYASNLQRLHDDLAVSNRVSADDAGAASQKHSLNEILSTLRCQSEHIAALQSQSGVAMAERLEEIRTMKQQHAAEIDHLQVSLEKATATAENLRLDHAAEIAKLGSSHQLSTERAAAVHAATLSQLREELLVESRAAAAAAVGRAIADSSHHVGEVSAALRAQSDRLAVVQEEHARYVSNLHVERHAAVLDAETSKTVAARQHAAAMAALVASHKKNMDRVTGEHLAAQKRLHEDVAAAVSLAEATAASSASYQKQISAASAALQAHSDRISALKELHVLELAAQRTEHERALVAAETCTSHVVLQQTAAMEELLASQRVAADRAAATLQKLRDGSAVGTPRSAPVSSVRRE